MTIGEKLTTLRKKNNITQEQLAETLGVSRQAVSKWESNAAYPETEKLVRIGELYNCSLDYLLKDSIEVDIKAQEVPQDDIIVDLKIRLQEKKSKKMLLGMPLWHIAKDARGFVAIGVKACGVIAIGVKARGIVSVGVLSLGLLSCGVLSLGLLSIGMLALGIISIGCFALGVFVTGAIAMGIMSIGAIAMGDFSVGAMAIGKYIAIGDNARGAIALGYTQATGTTYQKIGELAAQDIATVKQLLDASVPEYLSWAKEFIKAFFYLI